MLCLVPDVGDPGTGDEVDQEHEQHHVQYPQHYMGPTVHKVHENHHVQHSHHYTGHTIHKVHKVH